MCCVEGEPDMITKPASSNICGSVRDLINSRLSASCAIFRCQDASNACFEGLVRY
jgi:hypothetical protein